MPHTTLHKQSGNIYDGWDILLPKKIKDPEGKKVMFRQFFMPLLNTLKSWLNSFHGGASCSMVTMVYGCSQKNGKIGNLDDLYQYCGFSFGSNFTLLSSAQ
jgi:hypothetical protein